MHLTSLTLNDDIFELDRANERSLHSLFEYLRTQKQKIDVLWRQIQVNSLQVVHHWFKRDPFLEGHRDEDDLSRGTSYSHCVRMMSSGVDGIERQCLFQIACR